MTKMSATRGSATYDKNKANFEDVDNGDIHTNNGKFVENRNMQTKNKQTKTVLLYFRTLVTLNDKTIYVRVVT